MYCCRTATRSVSTAATFASVPARSVHQESGSWRSRWRTGSSDRTGWSTRADNSARYVDGVVDRQERGPAPVEVPEDVLRVEGSVPQLPRCLVLRGGHEPQPRRLPGGGAGRGTQGAPGPTPELPARLDSYVQRLGGADVMGAHALFGVRVRGR
ncbi:hypothetical protein QNO09_37730 [Streptomyces sp. 378]|uniref:hypothetical protein n=1 Tax=Streptomyces sp. 378 TaxID=3049412 RepID=UPI0024C33B41|nr:hypothetical protein [Streptomyces sp. 378]MDK1348898.1 hypothetical protein [Streptomyces sp. 378]